MTNQVVDKRKKKNPQAPRREQTLGIPLARAGRSHTSERLREKNLRILERKRLRNRFLNNF